MRRKSDILWKGILEAVFDDLLRFLFPHANRVFDMGKGFVFLDKELGELYPEPHKPTATRFVDKLVKVFTPEGNENYLLVHIEVQGHYDRNFAKRMFQYFYRLFDRYDRPVIPIAIFTGKEGRKMGDRYMLVFEGLELVYKFNTLDVMNYSNDELSSADNPFALVLLAVKESMLVGKGDDEPLLKRKILILRLLYAKGVAREKIEAIVFFMDNYLVFEKNETNLIFNEEHDRINGKKNTMNIYEQVAELRAEEAREETSRLFVENLLKRGGFSVAEIASLANVTVDFVRKVKRNCLK